MNRLSTFYQQVAREFAERVVRALDGAIQAVVLYGSVARGEATPESDIDVLVITPCREQIRRRIVAIEADIDAQHNYETFLTSMYFSSEQARQLGLTGSPLIQAVIQEGIVLYDDGTFARLRQAILAHGRPDARRCSADASEQPTPFGG